MPGSCLSEAAFAAEFEEAEVRGKVPSPGSFGSVTREMSRSRASAAAEHSAVIIT